MAAPKRVLWCRLVSAKAVVDYVNDFYEVNGYGPNRKEVAEFLEWPQTRNLPGVRTALREGRIRYDEDARLVPEVAK